MEKTDDQKQLDRLPQND